MGGCNPRNVQGAEHTGTANTEATDETEKDERRPIPRDRTAQGRNEIEYGHCAQTVATAKFIAGKPSQDGSQDGSPERRRNRHSQSRWRQVECFRQRMGGTSNYGCVQPQKKSAK